MESLINKKVEPFTVQAFHNGELKDVSDTDLQGHWSVIFFYPADFTFVCPTELEDLSDHYDQFRKLNCEIYSVSTDSAYVHKAWADASKSIAKIRYPMLSDSATWLSRFFGVYIEETGQALRGTFIINPQGEIEMNFYHESDCLPAYSERLIAPDGSIGHEITPEDDEQRGVTRHIHSRVLLNYHTARAVLEWLEDRVAALEEEGPPDMYDTDSGIEQ